MDGCLAGAAIGFAQNVYDLVQWFRASPTIVAVAHGNISVPPALSGWDVAGAIIFFIMAAAAIAVFVIQLGLKSDFERIVGEIDARTPQPFSGS